MSYKAKEGAGAALVDLITIAPQPRSDGVKPTRRTYSADGKPHDEGLHVALIYDMVEDQTELDDIFDQFGLDVATSAAVTIYCPNQMHVYTRYSGLAVRPDVSRRDFFLRDVTIIIRDLVAL